MKLVKGKYDGIQYTMSITAHKNGDDPYSYSVEVTIAGQTISIAHGLNVYEAKQLIRNTKLVKRRV